MVETAKAAIETLNMLRSSTEYKGQRVDIKENALNAQIANALRNKGVSVYAPKLLLLKLNGDDDIKLESTDCSKNGKVLGQINCLYSVRQKAYDKVKESGKENPLFESTDKLFQDFVKSLAGGENPQKQNPLSIILEGKELRELIGKDGKILFVEFAAAGGSYRVRRNFWVELFYTTLAPKYNGGAIVSYMLFDPQDSTVIKARTIRYLHKFKKFKFEKQEKLPSDNFKIP